MAFAFLDSSMQLFFSFIIPVYNRPDEVKELLESLAHQAFEEDFEVVIVEDGSSIPCEDICNEYADRLTISYIFKPNSGPGASRNYGMSKAKGNYFIVLDSDCILPPQYLAEAKKALEKSFIHCYGGPDAAHPSFSKVQKAINYAMTSFLTTGGIRGNKNAVGKFQPRSFNMGISKEAYEATQGFGNIHPGEDPDLTFRIWEKGYETRFLEKAYVFHKRRIDWNKFYIQVNKFGMVRPILNLWHPHTAKITYWFPTLFCLAFLGSIAVLAFGIIWPITFFIGYFIVLVIDSFIRNKKIGVALLSLMAVWIQFIGYGYGFLKSTLSLKLKKAKPEEIFPKLFFKKG